MTDAMIIRFPGPEWRAPDLAVGPEVVVDDEDFDTVRAAIEQEVEQAAYALGQCETEAEWLVKVNELVEGLHAAALRKASDG
jgi:hypothetical protein